MKQLHFAIFSLITFVMVAVTIALGYQLKSMRAWISPSQSLRTFRHEYQPKFVFDYSRIKSRFLYKELIDPELTLPSNVNLHAQREIFNSAKDCFKRQAPKYSSNSQEYKALIWEQFRCGRIKVLPERFFDSPPFMHFSGQSYAQLGIKAGILNSGPKHMLEVASVDAEDPQLRILNLLTMDSLHKLFNNSLFVDDQKYFLLRNDHGDDDSIQETYDVFDGLSWRQFKEKIGREVFLQEDNVSAACSENYLGSCWNFAKSESFVRLDKMFWASLALTLSFIIMACIFYANKYRLKIRQVRIDRHLLARITAHELRTPVTNLKLIERTLSQAKNRDEIETIAKEFSDQIRRLTLLTDASRLLLEADSSKDDFEASVQTELISDILATLETLSARRRVSFQIEDGQFVPNDEVTSLRARCQLGMLQICLENLIDNAQIHGRPPYLLNLRLEGPDLIVGVSDHGDFNAVRQSKGGLGIGLDLVRAAVMRMGGELKIKSNPTEVQLVLKVQS